MSGENERISKEDYPKAVAAEKAKLFKHIIVMTVLSAALAGIFYGALMAK